MTQQHTEWSDERIIAEAEAIAARCADWRDTRWAAQDTLRQMRDDMTREIAALQAENAALKQELAAAQAGREQLWEMYKEELLEHDPMQYDALYGDDGEGVRG